MSIERSRSVNSVKTVATPASESAAVGMTRTEFAKKLGVAALLAAASFMPATAVAGCIGEEFVVGQGTGGSSGEAPTGGSTSAAGTGGKENVGGGTSSTGGTGGKENVGGGGAGSSSIAGTGGVNVGGQGGAGTGGMENTGGQGGVGTGGMENTGGQGGTGGIINVGGGGAGGCLDIPVTIKGTNGQYEVKQYAAACVPEGVDTLGDAGFVTMATELCVKPNGSFLVQTKDATDSNSLEFTSPVVPTKVQYFQLGVSTPITDSEADAYCSANGSSLNPITADQDPAATEFKYVPSSVGPTNILKITY